MNRKQRRAEGFVNRRNPGYSHKQHSLSDRVAAIAPDLRDEITAAFERDEVLVVTFLDDGSGDQWPMRVKRRRRSEVVGQLPEFDASAPVRPGEIGACWVVATDGASHICVRVGATPMQGGGHA